MHDFELGRFIIENVSNVIVAVVGFFLVRAVTRLDLTLDRVIGRLDEHERRISTIEGGNAERQHWMGKTLGVLFLVFALAARAGAQATPTPATFNPLPANDASFFTVLRTFLLGEAPDRDATWESNFKITPLGCVHATVAGTTGTFTTGCSVFVAGALVTDPATAINYLTLGATATDFCWVIVTPEVNTSLAGWTRLPGTHYMGNCTAANTTRPTVTAAQGIFVMGTTITAGAITEVIDETSSSAMVRTYTNVTEVENRSDIIWRGPQDGVTPQVYCFGDDLGSCNVIPYGDAGGCATCGDSATAFFTSGQCSNARGCTGDDTSAVTGIPKIAAGNWTYPTRVGTADGGTNLDTSASTGALRVTAGSWSAQPFPDYRAVSAAPTWGTDGTQCTLDTTNNVINTNIPVAAVSCADNAAGILSGVFWLPAAYDPNTALVFTMSAANGGTTSGVLAFDFTCVCVGNSETVAAANYATPVNLDMTFSGTQGQQVSTISGAVSITCGGTCAIGDTVYWKATVDSASTTITTATDVRITQLQLEADQTALGN
jgi:hypothetical protein